MNEELKDDEKVQQNFKTCVQSFSVASKENRS
jgi:hypothetical protein